YYRDYIESLFKDLLCPCPILKPLSDVIYILLMITTVLMSTCRSRKASPSATPWSSKSRTTSTAFRARPGFIDIKVSAFQILPIEAFDCRLCFRFSGHLHKSKPSRSASVIVFYNLDGINLSKDLKSFFKILFGNLIR
ncbi:MAG: hypothetical protein QF888_04505, partial [Desulfobacterales bacterium]|nr:hypothetical protein [Desulfobacterales bacterium]